MLASITPLGERGRGNRFWLTAVAYAGGSAVGGALTGAVLGALGAAFVALAGSGTGVDTAAVATLAAATVAGLALDAGVAGLSLPTLRRQVDERWIGSYRGWVYGAGFGFQLGLGVVTIVTSSLTYVAMLGAALTGSVAGGVLVGTAFGVVRALPLAATARIHDPAALAELHRRMGGLARRARTVTMATQALLAAAAAALALGGTT